MAMNNSLAEVRPELVPEWSEKNLPLKPDEITFGSNSIRLYSLDEITEIFGKLGLRICNSFADFSGKPSSDNDIQLMVYSIRE